MDIPDELVDAKRAVELDLLGLPGLVGIGLGMREADGEFLDELAVRILVEDATDVPAGLPDEIGGVAVCIIERQAQPCGLPHISRYDDLMGGIRVSQPVRARGTLGALVEDASTGETLGLSCYHVAGGPGEDSVYQPQEPNLIAGVPASTADKIGDVVSSRVSADPAAAVVARPGQHGRRRRHVAGRRHHGSQDAVALDRRSGVRAAAAGHCRHCHLGPDSRPEPGTQARVRDRHDGWPRHRPLPLTLQWRSGAANTWLMEQMEILGDGIFCDDGDSGSLVLDEASPSAVGLLWGMNPAGLAPAGKIGYMCDIGNVESSLGVSVVFA